MNNDAKEKRMRPFPWKCGHCRERAVEMARFPYACDFAFDGGHVTVHVPELETPRCTKCGAIVLIDTANERIDNAFRVEVRLMMPDDIRQRRGALGLTQEELARRLGVDAATLARWESGAQFQTRGWNNLLELFFAYPIVRAHLGMPAPQERQPPGKAV